MASLSSALLSYFCKLCLSLYDRRLTFSGGVLASTSPQPEAGYIHLAHLGYLLWLSQQPHTREICGLKWNGRETKMERDKSRRNSNYCCLLELRYHSVSR